MRLIARARRTDSALNDESRNNPMKRGVIVPAALDELQKVTHVFGRQLRVHLERYVAETGVQENVLAHLIDSRVFEWLGLFAFDLDAEDLDRSNRQPVGVCRRERDSIDYIDAFGDLA